MEPTWQTEDGSVRLWLGDARDVLPLVRGDSTITDPPYGVGGGSGTIGKSGKASLVTWPDSRDDVQKVYAPIVRLSLSSTAGRGCVTPGTACPFMYPEPNIIGMVYQPAATGCCQWGRATCQPVLFYGKDPRAGKHLDPITFTCTTSTNDNVHPCPKPMPIAEWMVRRASVEGEVVVDPFFGAARIGRACIRNRRRYIGMEIDERYFWHGVEELQAELSRHPLLEPPRAVQRDLL